MVGMIDWQRLAERKYDIMQQGANADTSRARTARMTAQTQASLAPSAIGQAEADAALTRARAAGMPALMTSETALNTANAGLVGANTTAQEIQNNALSVRPNAASVEALSRLLGRPTFTSILESPTFEPVRSSTSPRPPAPVPASGKQPRNRGALSTIEDDNGVRISRGRGFI